MKKKILIVLSIVVVLLISVGLVKTYVDNAREKNSEEVPITHQAAIEIVKKTLDPQSMETIANLDNPKIEEVVFETNPSIAFFEGKKDITGIELYKITFNTTQDGLLGPIVLYVDKFNGDLIGGEFRE